MCLPNHNRMWDVSARLKWQCNRLRDFLAVSSCPIRRSYLSSVSSVDYRFPDDVCHWKGRGFLKKNFSIVGGFWFFSLFRKRRSLRKHCRYRFRIRHVRPRAFVAKTGYIGHGVPGVTITAACQCTCFTIGYHGPVSPGKPTEIT